MRHIGMFHTNQMAQRSKVHVYFITDSQFADFWAPRFMLLETDNAINTYNITGHRMSIAQKG